MNKLDLIIDALEDAVHNIAGDDTEAKCIEALAAARELRDMKPFAWTNRDVVRDEHGCWDDQRAVEKGWIPLYALGESNE